MEVSKHNWATISETGGKTVNSLPTIRPAQSILKRKFPSVP